MEPNLSQDYLTVGQAAKKMGVTVRTLQYYDKAGLLPPSAVSEGGRRLYTHKDLVQLHQILALKHLGFSLDDIKNRLIPLDEPGAVAAVLAEQAAALREQIDRLTQTLGRLETLRNEALSMQTVDFQKYADILINLEMKNDYYWLIKYFDGRTLDHIRSRFDRDSGMAFMQAFSRLQEEAVRLHAQGVPPDSPQGQAFAQRYWGMITAFTGGDMEILGKLMEFGRNAGADSRWAKQQAQANAFIGPALDVYFSRLGENPLQEDEP